MLRIIVLAALLLITGCTSNGNMTQKQVTPNQVPPKPIHQTRIETHAHTATPNSILTQASSTASDRVGKSSIMMKQAPIDPSNWFDWLNGQLPVKTPTNQAPITQAPTNQAPTNQTPTNQTPAKQPADQTNNASQFEQQVLDLVNKERSKVGLNSLSMNSKLSNMAMVKAKDMYDNNYFDHNSPTHGSPFDMMKKFGITYTTAGENIAKGQGSPTQVMNDWMNSPGHKANILKNSFTQIGIAYYNGEWVQEFIG